MMLSSSATRYWHHMMAKVAGEFQSEKLCFVIANEVLSAVFGVKMLQLGIYASGLHKFSMEEEALSRH